MMVMRECIRRLGRFPQILVVDGGREFESTYFETLLARYECTKKTRPPAQARFDSTCERLFGAANTQFIHNLRGNTQITRNVRQVTKLRRWIQKGMRLGRWRSCIRNCRNTSMKFMTLSPIRPLDGTVSA